MTDNGTYPEQDLTPLCGEEGCELCPTQADLDAFHERQQEDARQIVRYMLGLGVGNDG